MDKNYETVDSIGNLQNTITRVRKAQEEFTKFSQEKVTSVFTKHHDGKIHKKEC